MENKTGHTGLVSSLYRFIQHKTTSYNFTEVADHVHDQIRLSARESMYQHQWCAGHQASSSLERLSNVRAQGIQPCLFDSGVTFVNWELRTPTLDTHTEQDTLPYTHMEAPSNRTRSCVCHIVRSQRTPQRTIVSHGELLRGSSCLDSDTPCQG